MEEMKLKFDLEISRNQLESERMRSTLNHNVGDSNQDVGSFQMPKLPYFVDGKHNIDSYLARFETYARSFYEFAFRKVFVMLEFFVDW